MSNPENYSDDIWAAAFLYSEGIVPNEFQHVCASIAAKAIKGERERCVAICRHQADRSRGDHLVPEACMDIEEAILEGWEKIEL